MVQIFIKICVFCVQACLNNNGLVPSVLPAHLGCTAACYRFVPLVQFEVRIPRGVDGGCAIAGSGGCGGGGAVCGGVSPNRWNAAVLVRTCYRCPAVVAPPPSSLMTDSVLLLISALYCLPLSLVGWAESGTVPVIRSCRS